MPASGGPENGLTASPNPAQKPNTITVPLSDFLSRIPAERLISAEIDKNQLLSFDLGDIARRLGHSNPKIPLAEIYRRAPHIFSAEIPATDETAILFPWQRVVRLLQNREGMLGDDVSQTVLASLTRRLHEQKITRARGDAPVETPRTPARPAIPAAAPAESQDWFTRKPMPAGALTTLPAKPPARPTGVSARPLPRPAPPAPILLAPPVVAVPYQPRFSDDTLQTATQAHVAQVPEIERLIRETDLRMVDLGQEREALLQLKDHVVAQFELLTAAREETAVLKETVEAQAAELQAVLGELQATETQLQQALQERDRLLLRPAPAGGGIDGEVVPPPAPIRTAAPRTDRRLASTRRLATAQKAVARRLQNRLNTLQRSRVLTRPVAAKPEPRNRRRGQRN